MPGLGTKSGTAFRRDILANRPVAEPSIEGFFFFATDDNGGTFYQCDGTTWLPVTNGLRNVVAGTGISIVNSPSTITVSAVLSVATSSTLGAVKIGSNIFIDAGSHISVPIASPSILGVIRVGDGLVIDGDGILSVIDLPVEHNGTLVADRHILNLIDGTNVTLNIVDDAINDRVSVTINASGGGGGTTLNFYENAVMNDTPIAFWPLTEQGTLTTDTYADITGNGYDLHPRFSAADFVAMGDGFFRHVPGMFGSQTAPQCGTFFYDSTQAFWTANTTGLPYGSTPFTLEIWVKSDLISNGQVGTLIQYGEIKGMSGFKPRMFDIEAHYGWYYNEQPYVWLDAHAGSTLLSTRSFDHTPNDGNWNYITFTYDPVSGTAKRYYNGQLIFTNTHAGSQLTHTVDDVLFIGDSGFDVDFNYTTPMNQIYLGALSHAAIYAHQLSDAQVKAHWDAAQQTGINDRVVMCSVYNEGSPTTTLTNATAQLIPFTLAQFDMGTSVPHHDSFGLNDRITIQEAGFYEVSGKFVIEGANNSIDFGHISEGHQYRSIVSSPISVPPSTDTAITFDTVDWYTDNENTGFSGDRTQLKVRADGIYHFDVNITISADADLVGAVKSYTVSLLKNGTTTIETVSIPPPAYNAQDITLRLSTDYPMAGSEYMQVIVNQTSVNTQTVRVNSDVSLSRYDAGGSLFIVQLGINPDPAPFFSENVIIDESENNNWSQYGKRHVLLHGFLYLQPGDIVQMLAKQWSGANQPLPTSFFFDEWAVKLSVRKITHVNAPYAGILMTN